MRSNPLQSWSLAVPLLVLAGLFGMHGLGDHADAHSFVHQSMAVPDVTPTGSDVDVLLPLTHGGMSGGMSGGMAACCVAVLLLGLFAGLFRGRTLRRTSWALPRQAWLRAPIPRSRAPDPPTPLLLSVCRC